MNLPPLLEWFRDEHLPGTLPDPAIVAGGTALLREFVGLVGASRCGGELSIATPFASPDIDRDLPGWPALPCDRINLKVVTRTHVEAAKLLDQLTGQPWQSLVLNVHPRLHSKIYVFSDAQGGGAALIGSHNLTRGGTQTNDEAGVLFSTRQDSQVTRIIQSCSDRITDLMREGEIFTDTLRWPTNRTRLKARRCR